MEEEKTSIQLLVISDIHKDKAWSWLRTQVTKEVEANNFDFVLNCGDFTFIAYEEPQPMEERLEKEKLFCTIKRELEVFDITHIYVPGNHDPEEEYSESYSGICTISSPSVNIHKRCIQLAPHLWIVGCGGSVPTTLKDGSLYKTGYPYVNEDMKEGIRNCLSLIPKGDQVIVLTHNPPSHIGSSFMDCKKHSDKELYYGSDTLYNELVESMKDYDIFLFIHGHVHHEPGMNWIHQHERDCCIINPGSTMGSRYAKVKLQKVNGQWKVSGVQHEFQYDCLFIYQRNCTSFED